MTSSEVVRQTPKQKTLAKLITDMEPELAKALPKHVTPQRMARIATTVVRATPKLAECSPASFLGALLTASQLGLEPGPTGEAYFVPYGQTCTFIPGYRGLIKLARNSGQISDIYAEIVYENDHFKVTRGLDRNIEHEEPAERGADRGKPTNVYAVAKFKDGERTFVTMTVAEVEKIRKRSRASGDGPWVTDWEAMAKKTAVRQLAKWLPLSAEFKTAIELDGTVRTDIGPLIDVTPDYVDGEVVPDESAAAVEPAQDAPPAEPAEDPAAEVLMASKTQLAKLKQIREMEKYEADDEWFAALSTWVGRPIAGENDLTREDADAALSVFADGES